MCLGIPGQVVELDDSSGLPMGTVDFGGLRKDVCLAYVPEVRLGDYVIVHVGFAITLVDEVEARRTLDVLRAMGDAVEAELGERLPPADNMPMENKGAAALNTLTSTAIRSWPGCCWVSLAARSRSRGR